MTTHDDFQAYVLSLSPVALWTFQGLAPGALHDVTGNGHDLTGHGTFTLTNNVPGFDGFQYANMDGVTAYFTPATPAAFNLAQFTMVGLFFPQQANSYMMTTEVAVTSGVTLGVSDNAHSQALLGRMQDTGGAGITLIDTKPFGAYGSAFSLFGCAYDGISLQLSANGAPVNAQFNPVAYVPGTAVLHIGSNVLQTIFLKGGISDVAVFNRALVLSELQTIASKAGVSIALNGAVNLDLLNQILAAVRHTY